MSDINTLLDTSQAALSKAKQARLPQFAARMQQTAASGPDALEKAAREFEAVFLSQMLTPMFAETEMDPPFGGGFSESMYRSLLIDEYGKLLARTGGVGVADQVKREMIRMQEVRHGSPI